MDVLVTGGAGYIGSHVALSLLDAGYNVTIIDDLSNGHTNLIPNKAKFIKANINDTHILKNLFQTNKFNTLFHFAGFVKVEESIHFPEKYFTNNTKNSSILFNACIEFGLNNIIFSSTAAVYGNPKKNLIDENADLNPLNPYGESKVQTENLLLNLQKEQKIQYVILRYFNVAGADPQLRSGLISPNPTHLIKIASEASVGKREKVTIYGNDYNTHDGTAVRDYIHVSDLADIHVKSLEYLMKKNESLIMNCGYGKGYSVKEILNKINVMYKKQIKIDYGKRRPGDAELLISNVKKLIETINWKPKYNNLESIIQTAIRWEEKLLNEKIF